MKIQTLIMAVIFCFSCLFIISNSWGEYNDQIEGTEDETYECAGADEDDWPVRWEQCFRCAACPGGIMDCEACCDHFADPGAEWIACMWARDGDNRDQNRSCNNPNGGGPNDPGPCPPLEGIQ